jgi:hypothetical protein
MPEAFEPPYLTDAEIAAICEPLVMPGAQYRHLVRLGLHAARKPNGRPLVARSEFERVLGAARMTSEQKECAGDLAALRARWRDRHGTQTQGR